jgi:hypothetical protein
MGAASVDLTGSTWLGNFGNMNALPGETITRSRLVKCSAVGGAGVSTMSAGCTYKIFNIPSFYYVKSVRAITVTSCSEATGGWLTVGDADASTTWISVIGCSRLGAGGSLADFNASLGLGLSAFGPSHLILGKFYSNGGEIQVGAVSAEGTARFWVIVEAVNLTPV